ncbi:hypothetical protein L3X38_025174 [Prunus dulcis]|uniref:Putative plant transposon protein domain-containing protein n=1 Tax=Prunus dulcis TaxID=3755 RepID=A0AAD4W3R2_PRUDU|nr:hypothetical protein L3X38_025174 [Prunus dulcis]
MSVSSKLRSSTRKASSSQMASDPLVTIGGLSKFTSPKASKFFSLVSKRQFVLEHRYILGDLYLSDMSCDDALFTHYQLHKLNSISCRFNASMVHELYSNFPCIPTHTKYRVSVRHIMVLLNPHVIDRSITYVDPFVPLTAKDLPLKSYLKPMYKFLWDFVRRNILSTANNSNPTLFGCQLMLSLINKDPVPLGEIIFHAICSKSRSHGKIQGDSSSSSSITHKKILHYECKIQYLKGLLHNDPPVAAPSIDSADSEFASEDSAGSAELS